MYWLLYLIVFVLRFNTCFVFQDQTIVHIEINPFETKDVLILLRSNPQLKVF